MAKKKRFIDYPRWGRTGVRRWLPSWRLILGTFATFVVLAIASLAAAVALVQVPEPNDVARAQVTTFYWNDGTYLSPRWRLVGAAGRGLPGPPGRSVRCRRRQPRCSPLARRRRRGPQC